MNEEIRQRTKWFMEDRFGMFIHWGLYSIPACGEWMMSQKEMTIEEYSKYFDQFDPVDYDPKKWVRLAKKAGMKYVVLTAKHHDGFCLFDSKLTDYKSTNTKAGRDLVREFVDACREEGLKVGLYFSIIDWHHPDFPKYGDRQHPMRNNPAYKDEKIDFDRYLAYMHGQIKELVTGYGKLDLLWFDFSYDDMTGEKWKATELIEMVRKYQPDVIIDNRLEGAGDNHGSITTEEPLIYSGDFASPEQIIPPKGVCDDKGEPIPWGHHPDFPKYGDGQHPMRNNPAYKDEKIDFDRYLAYMHGQIKELVTGYGKLDLLWFDFSYDDMTGEKWKATELIEMVRKYQPDVIIDNRLEGAGDNHGSITTEEPLIYSGDFASPEQIIPPKGVCDDKGEPIPWELCATMNNHWGYCNFDHQYKTPQMLVRKLVECASKGGNMILNVGPDARGNIPEESVQILTEVGKWMKKNGESIYGCGISKLEKPDWGRYTQKGDIIYAHVYETPLGALPLYGIGPDKLESVTYLADGSEVNRGEAWNTVLYPDVAFVSFGDDPVFTYPLPDEKDTVLKIRLRQE